MYPVNPSKCTSSWCLNGATDPSASIAANTFIEIVTQGDQFLVLPRRDRKQDAPVFDPFPLPMLTAQPFERMSRLLRMCWRRASASATWLLYLDPQQRIWRCVLPPQMCRLDGSSVSVSEALPEQELLVKHSYTVSFI